MKAEIVSFNKNKNLIQLINISSSPSPQPTTMERPLLSIALIQFTLLAALWTLSGIDGYDPLDPAGNITVTFDIHQWTQDGYVARVTIQNHYQYRIVDKPGWRLGWTWSNDDIIWSMSGAFAAEQGNCSAFKFQTPHSCVKDPEIVDWMQDAPAENRTQHCCRGGVLAAHAINPADSLSSFEMMVGNSGAKAGNVAPPVNLTLMAPGLGYTCSRVLETAPTVSSDFGGQRQVQVYRTWKSSCTYSTFLASKKRTCCVSLSTFYNSNVTQCAKCSCGCKGGDQSTKFCVSKNTAQSKVDAIGSKDLLQCTDHMCPVQVHWHVMRNYLKHWRVKLTISNFNYKRNYSEWNVVVQHPGFKQKAEAYSFNKTLLPTTGFADEVALFWGLSGYNELLLQAKETGIGSETTEIVLEKNLNSFSFRNGWALPRRIYFNGESCEMPLPDVYPMLPNGSRSNNMKQTHCVFLILLMFISKILVF